MLFLVPCWKNPRLSSWFMTLRTGYSNSGATRFLWRAAAVLVVNGHHTHYFYPLLKVIGAGQKVQALEEEENAESLVCTVLAALHELEKSKVCYIFSSHCGLIIFGMIDERAVLLCFSKRIPESWEFIISQELVLKLLGQEDLFSPEEHLQMFNSPLNIRMDFGKKHSQTFPPGLWEPSPPGPQSIRVFCHTRQKTAFTQFVFYLVGQRTR